MLHHIALLIALPGFPAPTPTGPALLRMMHDRYAGKWYQAVRFVQHNTAWTRDGSEKHSTWIEESVNPGRLRIEFLPTDSGQGVIYAADSEYDFQNDSLVNATAFMHPLMVLGPDIAFLPPDRTIDRVKALGYDLSVTHEDTWQGRSVIVVGAKAGDTHTRQFWVDRERLVVVRTLEPGPRDSTRTVETQLNGQQKLGDGWIETQTKVLVNGRPVWQEDYTEITIPTSVPDQRFDPRRWKTSRIPDR